MNAKLLAAVAIAAVLLSGCASQAEPAPAGTPTLPPADGGSYSTVLELKDAFVAAGGSCSEFDQTNAVKLAAESGKCGSEVVLSTYLSSDDVSQVIQNVKELNDDLNFQDGAVWLAGQNWIINGPNAKDMRERLGGRLVSF